MNNITYTIEEVLSNNESNSLLKDISLNSSSDKLYTSHSPNLDNYDTEISIKCNELIARQIDYEMNYNVNLVD